VLGFAIVDEVDSILIDESRNPMIISQPRSDNGSLVATVDGVSGRGSAAAAAAAAPGSTWLHDVGQLQPVDAASAGSSRRPQSCSILCCLRSSLGA
jgi:hypothetical protein